MLRYRVAMFAALLLLSGAASADAQQGRRARFVLRDRAEDVRDRVEDRRDRREDVLDRRENLRDRRRPVRRG